MSGKAGDAVAYEGHVGASRQGVRGQPRSKPERRCEMKTLGVEYCLSPSPNGKWKCTRVAGHKGNCHALFPGCWGDEHVWWKKSPETPATEELDEAKVSP